MSRSYRQSPAATNGAGAPAGGQKTRRKPRMPSPPVVDRLAGGLPVVGPRQRQPRQAQRALHHAGRRSASGPRCETADAAVARGFGDEGETQVYFRMGLAF